MNFFMKFLLHYGAPQAATQRTTPTSLGTRESYTETALRDFPARPPRR